MDERWDQVVEAQFSGDVDGQIFDVAWGTANQGIIDLANVGRIADKFAIQPFVCNSVGEEQLEASVELEIGQLGFASTFFETFYPIVTVDGLAKCVLPEPDTSEIEPPEPIDFTLDLSGGACSQYASEYSETMEMTAQPAPGAQGLWNVGMVNSESGQAVHSVPWDASSGEPLVLVFVGEYSDKYEFNPETGMVDYTYVDVNGLECFWQGAILDPQDLEDFDMFFGELVGATSVPESDTGQGVPEHSVTIGNIRYVIRAVTEVRTGADLGFTVCGYDVDSGEPLEGETGYFTIGNDPGSSLASHANGIFGSDGCFLGSVHVQEPPPITQGFVSDGSAVEKWGDITILPGEDPPEEDPEQFLRLLVDGLRGNADFLVSRLNDATIVIYGEEQCRATLAGLSDPQTELEIREIGSIATWDYVVDGITTPIPNALPVEVQRLADGQTIIQELHWQLVDGLWTWFSDCGEPIPG